MNDHIGKPFEREALVGVVHRWLNRRSRSEPEPGLAHAAFDEASYRATRRHR